jgi:uncharacterized membrane protein YgcG
VTNLPTPLARTYGLQQPTMNNLAIILAVCTVIGVGLTWALGRSRAQPTITIAALDVALKRRLIAKLDLQPVRDKAAKRHGWTTDLALSLEAEYRDFLILLAENDGSVISPWSGNLDLFWHEHILDTQRYAADCASIFGHLIQHDPHIEERADEHAQTVDKTMALRTAQLQARAERRRAASTTATSASDAGGFDIVMWGCAGSHTGSDSSSSHSSDHGGGGHSCAAHGGGHSCGGGGHSCGGHSCGGHGCGGH